MMFSVWAFIIFAALFVIGCFGYLLWVVAMAISDVSKYPR